MKLFKSRFLQCIAAGILFGVSFPPLNFHIGCIFALAYYIYLVQSSASYRSLLADTYIMIVSFQLFTISWIALSGFREGADSFLIVGGIMTIILHPIVFYLPPTAIYKFVSKTFRKENLPYLHLIFFCIIWTGYEYVQTLGQITFPWLSLGYTQTYNPHKIQFIEYTGMFGIAMWICILSSLVYYTFDKRIKGLLPVKKGALMLGILLTIYFIPDAYTFVSGAEKFINRKDAPYKVSIVQPNINPFKKWGAKQIELTYDYLNQIKEADKLKPQLIILPETAFPFYLTYESNDEKYKIISRYIDSASVPVLTGAPDLYVYRERESPPPDAKIRSDGRHYDTYNTAILIEPGKAPSELQRHNKMKLVIGSERMPYQEKILFLKDLVKWTVGLSSFQIGQGIHIFTNTDGVKFNTAICYESVYPEFFAESVNMGAQFSTIITNDGWWGKLFGTHQHNQYAVLRAIENRRWIARCANTGISCTIDQYGNIYNATEIDEKIVISDTIGLSDKKTFYTLNGDTAGKYSALIMAGFFAASAGVRIRRKFFT